MLHFWFNKKGINKIIYYQMCDQQRIRVAVACWLVTHKIPPGTLELVLRWAPPYLLIISDRTREKHESKLNITYIYICMTQPLQRLRLTSSVHTSTLAQWENIEVKLIGPRWLKTRCRLALQSRGSGGSNPVPCVIFSLNSRYLSYDRPCHLWSRRIL